MMIRYAALLLALLLFFVPVTSTSSTASAAASIAVPVELRGSPVSMERQHAVAVEAGVAFAKTPEDIERMVETGELVPLLGNDYYEVRDNVSFKVARPEMRIFVERLAEEYFAATGEQLVVTSLTRSACSQPGNSHNLSIHPTGLALDLRISQQAASRQWIEARLLEMEAQGLLDVTRESHPPHYHLALFPDAYLAYLEAQLGADALAAALSGETEQLIEEDLTANADEMAPRRARWSFLAALFGRA
jgi:hypothetical protein